MAGCVACFHTSINLEKENIWTFGPKPILQIKCCGFSQPNRNSISILPGLDYMKCPCSPRSLARFPLLLLSVSFSIFSRCDYLPGKSSYFHPTYVFHSCIWVHPLSVRPGVTTLCCNAIVLVETHNTWTWNTQNNTTQNPPWKSSFIAPPLSEAWMPPPPLCLCLHVFTALECAGQHKRESFLRRELRFKDDWWPPPRWVPIASARFPAVSEAIVSFPRWRSRRRPAGLVPPRLYHIPLLIIAARWSIISFWCLHHMQVT